MNFAKRVTLIGRGSQNEIEENWLVFERNVAHLIGDNRQVTDNIGLAVQIAFFVSDYKPNGRPNIVRLRSSYLNVLFPTEKETNLGFLIQGPYRTTPARDNIPQADNFNIALAKETGELVVDALLWMRDRDWLTTDVLNTMPLTYMQSEYGYEWEINPYRRTMFEPVYERVKQALMNKDLIPAYGGGYVSAKDARIAGSEALRDLLDTSQLQQLLEFDEQTRWLSEEITEGRTRELWRYLTTILEVEEIDAEMFVRRIDHDFICNQSDDWIRRFYEFAPSGSAMLNILRDRPIIRLADGSHVKPFRWNEPIAYLPKDDESRFPTVKREVCNSEESLAFLKKLGLKEPNDVDEVLTLILPKYKNGQEIHHASAEHKKDIARIMQALGGDSQARKRELLSALKSTPILWATNAVGKSAFREPGDVIYFRNPTLELYFEGNHDAWFISSEYEPYFDDLQQLDVFHGVAYSLRKANPRDGHVSITREWGYHKRGLNGFDPNFRIDGLEFALMNPSVERSAYIWNRLLIPRKHSVIGDVETSSVQTYPSDSRTAKKEDVLSIAGKLLREIEWLPGGKGHFVRPSMLSLEELPDGFQRDADLANALGMDSSTDYPDEVKEMMAATKGRTPEEVLEALALSDEMKMKERETVETLEPESFESELENRFNLPDNRTRRRVPPPFPADLPDIAPDERLEDDIENEPDPEERYDIRFTRSWQPRNPMTRKFLEQKYEGRCQICDYTFEQRNGTDYFEAIHFISRTTAQWADDQRNAICLCANHSAQFLHGRLETPDADIIEQIASPNQGQEDSILIMLCGEPQLISFEAEHMAELRALLGGNGIS